MPCSSARDRKSLLPNRGKRAVSWRVFRITDYGLRITDYGLRFEGRRLPLRRFSTAFDEYPREGAEFARFVLSDPQKRSPYDSAGFASLSASHRLRRAAVEKRSHPRCKYLLAIRLDSTIVSLPSATSHPTPPAMAKKAPPGKSPDQVQITISAPLTGYRKSMYADRISVAPFGQGD